MQFCYRSLNGCCIFQPVFGSCTLQTLLKIYYFHIYGMFFQNSDAKIMKNEAKISFLKLIPKHWLTQKCWSSAP